MRATTSSDTAGDGGGGVGTVSSVNRLKIRSKRFSLSCLNWTNSSASDGAVSWASFDFLGRDSPLPFAVVFILLSA